MTDAAACCEPMEMALEYSRIQDAKMRHTPIPGFVRVFLLGNKGRQTGNHFAYYIPAHGRGGKRVLGKNILLNVCPFCGHEYQKMEGVEQVTEVRVPARPAREVKMGTVSSEAVLNSPGLRLDAHYHLDAPHVRRR